jgi:hypothetical protein
MQTSLSIGPGLCCFYAAHALFDGTYSSGVLIYCMSYTAKPLLASHPLVTLTLLDELIYIIHHYL